MKRIPLATQVAAIKTNYGPMSSFVPDLKNMVTTRPYPDQEVLINQIVLRAYEATRGIMGSQPPGRIYQVEGRTCFYRVKGPQFVKVTFSPDEKVARITNSIQEIRRTVRVHPGVQTAVTANKVKRAT